jgi:hypothetical protein
MIGDGQFAAQLETAESILRRMKILAERQAFPNKALGAADFRGLPYREVYGKCVREFAYDFRLSDQSLLLFVKSGDNVHNGLSFSYYEPPAEVLPYEEFVAAQLGLSPSEPDFQDAIDSWGDELRVDYEQYVDSAELKKAVTPVRYDCKASDYRPGVHPASHVHFGFATDIRVGTRRVLNPLSFILFILRQRYLARGLNSEKRKNSHYGAEMSVKTST